ncbi:MAG: flagellar motor switch protein FliN [Chlamydiales bacterium]|nr:flagellar motor switch protein FliN [Chlamydiales bacterium]NCF71472.1 flagellar motor switch protein FliN [Chlamydiales bacterium]
MSDDLSPDEVESISKAMKDKEGEETELHSKPSISKAKFLQLEELAEAANLPPTEIQRFSDVKVNVEVRLGEAKLALEEILNIHKGDVVELDKLAGEPVDLFANDILIARGEVVVIDDSFGVKVLEIIGTNRDLIDR